MGLRDPASINYLTRESAYKLFASQTQVSNVAPWGSAHAMGFGSASSIGGGDFPPELALQLIQLRSRELAQDRAIAALSGSAAWPLSFNQVSGALSYGQSPALLHALMGVGVQNPSLLAPAAMVQPPLGFVAGGFAQQRAALIEGLYKEHHLMHHGATVDPPQHPQHAMPSGAVVVLPTILARPEDGLKLSPHQVLLRHQIEAFQAAADDVMTHTRGRNKPITIGQVGIRCRYCSHLSVSRRQKGSTYFPATLLGEFRNA